MSAKLKSGISPFIPLWGLGVLCEKMPFRNDLL